MSDTRPRTELDLAEYIFRRHQVYHRRHIAQQLWPWTDDPIIDRYHFRNVMRVLDRNSRYLIRAVLRRGDMSDEAKLFNIVFFRLFNQAGIYDRPGINVLDPSMYNHKEIEDALDEWGKDGRNLFNNAYLITGRLVIDANYRRAKHAQVLLGLDRIRVKLTPLIARLKSASAPKEAHSHLRVFPYCDGFMASQIFQDLTYFDFFPQRWTANDIIFVPYRAQDGIQLLTNNGCQLKEMSDYCRSLASRQEGLFTKLKQQRGFDWSSIAPTHDNPTAPYLPLMDVQLCISEAMRYWCAQDGVSMPRVYSSRNYHRDQAERMRSLIPA